MCEIEDLILWGIWLSSSLLEISTRANKIQRNTRAHYIWSNFVSHVSSFVHVNFSKNIYKYIYLLSILNIFVKLIELPITCHDNQKRIFVLKMLFMFDKLLI